MDDPETLVVRVVPDGGGAAEDTLRAPPSAAPDCRGVLDDASASRSRRQTSRRRSLRAGSNSLGATPSHRDRASSFVLEADDALTRLEICKFALDDSLARLRRLPPGPFEVEPPPKSRG